MFDLSALTQGFILGMGLFICPGPKDVLILREALAGRSSGLLVGIGAGSDLLLIAFGMLGLSAILQRLPVLQEAALLLGIGLLLIHGLQAARNAWRGGHTPEDGLLEGGASRSLRPLLVTSFLNPVAWLDTVLIIGSLGASLPLAQQPSFGLGAVAASLGWFSLFVFGARHARRWMTAAHTWRLLDAAVAVAMLGMAGYLIATF